MSLNPPTEHQLLVFWVGLLVILVAARLLGAVMQRIGQPAVMGELAAGLILGPSVLGKLAPDITDWLFPADDVQTGMLFTVGWLGVLFLLVSTGFETDLGLIGRLGRAAVIVSAGSLLVPAIAGFAVGWFLPMAFVGSDTERYIFALFVAAALSISSLPVIAKILGEMGLMRRKRGRIAVNKIFHGHLHHIQEGCRINPHDKDDQQKWRKNSNLPITHVLDRHQCLLGEAAKNHPAIEIQQVSRP